MKQLIRLVHTPAMPAFLNRWQAAAGKVHMPKMPDHMRHIGEETENSCSVYERRGSHGHATLKDMPPMAEKSHRFINQSFAHPYAVIPLLALVAIWFTMIPFSIWDQHKLVDKVTPPGEFSTEHMAEVPAKKI